MKKFCAGLVLLFLVACDRMTGESYTRCVEVAEGLVGSDIGTTMITVQGYDEEILLWTVHTTLTREAFEQEFQQGLYLSDDEIHELFEGYSQQEVEGITFYVTDLTHDDVVIAKVYDYSVISTTYLNRIWDVDNFEDAVTVSSAISGLEDQGAICEIVEIEAETEEEGVD